MAPYEEEEEEEEEGKDLSHYPAPAHYHHHHHRSNNTPKHTSVLRGNPPLPDTTFSTGPFHGPANANHAAPPLHSAAPAPVNTLSPSSYATPKFPVFPHTFRQQQQHQQHSPPSPPPPLASSSSSSVPSNAVNTPHAFPTQSETEKDLKASNQSSGKLNNSLHPTAAAAAAAAAAATRAMDRNGPRDVAHPNYEITPDPDQHAQLDGVLHSHSHSQQHDPAEQQRNQSKQHAIFNRYKKNLKKNYQNLNKSRHTSSSSSHYQHPHPPKPQLRQQEDATDVFDFRVEAGAPQLIRIAGFRDIFERYYNRLDQATCHFGVSVDDQVRCRCDTLHGTIECDVPRMRSNHFFQSTDETLVVKVHIAEFETPPIIFRYSTFTYGGDSSTDLLRKHSASASASEQHQREHSDDVSGDEKRHPRLDQKSSALNNHDNDDDDDDYPENFSSRSKSIKKHYLHLLSNLSRDHLRNNNKQDCKYSLLHQCIAECIGTMFIVVFGVGSVCSSVVLKEGSVDLWHIASVWGFGVTFAILVSTHISGGHLNPAVSLAFALFRPLQFPLYKLLPYWFAQYLGGVLGGAFNLMVFGPTFRHFESVNNIIRGEQNSLITASAFGEYFPAPVYGKEGIPNDVVSPPFAMMVEAWGTCILTFIIFALTDTRNKSIRNKEMVPFYIGFTVATLIALYAPITQAGWNPARDFGPRIVAALSGWGRLAIPGPRNGFWVYIIGPKIGAPIGAFLYNFLLNPALPN